MFTAKKERNKEMFFYPFKGVFFGGFWPIAIHYFLGLKIFMTLQPSINKNSSQI